MKAKALHALRLAKQNEAKRWCSLYGERQALYSCETTNFTKAQYVLASKEAEAVFLSREALFTIKPARCKEIVEAIEVLHFYCNTPATNKALKQAHFCLVQARKREAVER